MSTDGLRPAFYTINGVVYAIQVTSPSTFLTVDIIASLYKLIHETHYHDNWKTCYWMDHPLIM